MLKANSDLEAAISTAADRYRLTTAEARVLSALVQCGGGVEAIATSLGLSRSTVKTHLEKLFKKTRTSRQAALVTLVAGLHAAAGTATTK